MIRDSVIDWQELSGLYEEADALDESGLAAYLEQLRAQKHRLLGQLERMLAARARIATGTFLESLPHIATAPSSASEWAEGGRIGAYRLIRPIGSGGMAEVWLAERADGAFERQVAIKLLFNHPTRAQRESFVERFKRERDILASLHHPNIAGLHDAGVTASGQPWLALEYVQGEPITAWCDAKGLAIEARVEVFRQVLLAVEYAHANLVIHRDLKPSNILVTDEGEVKLLDFGIAKLIEGDDQGMADTELTRQMGRPLTVMYASPEQMEGKSLTTASDVYSAGVVLYELVTRQRPYDLADPSPARLSAAIISVDPVPPSRRAAGPQGGGSEVPLPRLGRAAAADLDAVVMKALAKEPGNRYHSAEAMRTDLARWSQHRPVEAQPPSAAYRARRFVLRHRLGVSLGGSAIAALLVVTTTAVVLGVKARAESERAVSARNFVQDIFRVADPDQSRGNDITARSILVKGRVNAEQMFAAQPILLGEVLATIGDMQITIGDHNAADVTLQRVVALYASEGRSRELVRAKIELAKNATFLGDFEKASTLSAEAASLAAKYPKDNDLQGAILYVQALVANRSGRAVEARQLMLQAGKRIDAWDRDSERAIDVLQVLTDIDLALGDSASALARIEDAEERARRNPRIGPRARTKTDFARVRLDIAAGQYGPAERRLATLIPACDARLGSQTEECLIMRRRSVVALIRTGHTGSAVEVARQLVPSVASETSPQRKAESLFVICQALAVGGKAIDHPDLFAELRRVATASDQSPTYRSIALMTLSESALLAGDPEQGARLAKEAIDEQLAGSVSPLRTARAKMLLGLAQARQDRHREALNAFEESTSMFAEAMGVRHPLTALFRLNALGTFRALGQAEQVRYACAEASAILVPALGGESPAMQSIASLCGPKAASTPGVTAPFL